MALKVKKKLQTDLWLFLIVLWVGQLCVIVVFPDHTHLLLFRQKDTIYFEDYNLTPLDMYNGISKVISSIQKEESISIQRVKSSRHVAVAAIHSYELLVFVITQPSTYRKLSYFLLCHESLNY